MATPHVAGCWAILKAAKPSAGVQEIEAALKAIWENEAQLAPIHPMLKEWTRDRARCERVYVPPTVRFQEKWRLALTLLRRARAAGRRR